MLATGHQLTSSTVFELRKIGFSSRIPNVRMHFANLSETILSHQNNSNFERKDLNFTPRFLKDANPFTLSFSIFPQNSGFCHQNLLLNQFLKAEEKIQQERIQQVDRQRQVWHQKDLKDVENIELRAPRTLYCHICCHFIVDYFTHIRQKGHLRKIRSKKANRYIKELCREQNKKRTKQIKKNAKFMKQKTTKTRGRPTKRVQEQLQKNQNQKSPDKGVKYGVQKMGIFQAYSLVAQSTAY